MTTVLAPPARPPLSIVVLRPAKASAIIESRRLLESDIGLDVVLQAVQMRVAAEPESPTPSKLALLLEGMEDPDTGIHGLVRQSTITELMQASHVTFFDLLQLIAERQKAFSLAKSARHMDQVLEDIAEDAKSRTLRCRSCDGGWIHPPADDNGDAPAPVECDDCAGTGRIRKVGDLESRKLYFKAHGIGADEALRNRPTTNINVNAQAGVRIGEQKPPEPSVLTRVQTIIDG